MPYFTDTLKAAFNAADLIIARAGSATLFEIASFGKPAILIPLSDSANDHQRANAYSFAKNGAAIVIEESNLLPGILVNEVKKILSNKALQESMGVAAKQFFVPDAADKIAEGILKMTIGE